MKDLAAVGSASTRTSVPNQNGAYEPAIVDTTLMIDAKAIQHELAQKAAKNKSKRATMLGGAIVVQVTAIRQSPPEGTK